MADGKLYPYSSEPDGTGFIGRDLHLGATNNRRERGMRVIGSLASPAIWYLNFGLYETLPGGTPTINFQALANANTGILQFAISWAAVNADGGNPDTAVLSSEGTFSLDWSSGPQNDAYKRHVENLNATTMANGQIVVMEVTFQGGATLLQPSVWQAYITWV